MANTTEKKGFAPADTDEMQRSGTKGNGAANGNFSASAIREHMDVVASCGTSVGKVDRVEGQAVKLTKNDSPDGKHHFIPMGWVENVDEQVHLRKNSEECKQGWKADAASCAGAC